MKLECMYCKKQSDTCSLPDYFSMVSTLKCRACRGKRKSSLNYQNNNVVEF